MERELVGGKYWLGDKLGEGGMGAVYRAQHAELGHAVAIKLIFDPRRGLSERLLQEGKAQARVRHPNLVPVTDVLHDHRGPMLVMELVDGVSLDRLIERGPLTLEQLDQIASGMLAGMAAAHRQGWVHRDLKPANVLCQDIDGVIVPRISDFGLAKALDVEDGLRVTRSGVLMGSLMYMSPEHVRSPKHVDRQTDVWAIGAILYEAACGVPTFPWDGVDQMELFHRILEGRFTPLRRLRPGLPERIYRAVEAALEPDCTARAQSCEDLQALWFSEASPPPARRPAPRWKLGVALTALAAGATGVLVAGVVAGAALMVLAVPANTPERPSAPVPIEAPLDTPALPAPVPDAPVLEEPGPQPPDEPAQEQEAPAPLRPKPGKLLLDARPYSEIWVDGVHRGKGRVELSVEAGSHRVKLVVVGGARQGQSREDTVKVDSAKLTSYCWDFEGGPCLDWP